MTINDIAKAYGVSRQAVYQRLKRKGVQLKDLQKEDSLELTEEGEALFREMFQQGEPSQTLEETTIQQIDSLTRENEQLRNRIKDLEHEIDLEREAHKGTRENLKRADEGIRQANEEINFLRLSVSQAQETVSRTTLLLESRQQKQTGFLARLFRKENTK